MNNSAVNKIKALYKKLRHRARIRRFAFRLSKNGVKSRVIYLMGLGEDFPNLGDQAQAAAIPIWLKRNFGRSIVEVKSHELVEGIWNLRELISPEDIIFLHSGGNFGDDWYETQQLRERIIADLSSNLLVQLPQTIHYSAGEIGRSRLMKSQTIFDACKKIMLIGRDKISAENARGYFDGAAVRAMPDMVLSLQDLVRRRMQYLPNKKEGKRRILLIMRNDKEGVYSAEDKERVAAILRENGYEAQFWDTDVSDRFPDSEKIEVLLKYLHYISSFDAVITDRYHGLIFTVLVERPCVVLRTHNHKLTSAFDWFEKVNYVRLAEEFSQIPGQLRELAQLATLTSPNWNEEYFDKLAVQVSEFTGMALTQSPKSSNPP